MLGMLFNSYEFIFVFLPITIGVYFSLAKKHWIKAATMWLFIASLAFYSYWNILYLPLLLLSICFNFIMGKKIEARRTKVLLAFGVGFNLLLLGYFKYAGFFVSSLNMITGNGFIVPQIILPLGISFFTFTQTAYLIDAYRGETNKYSFLTYALFVTVFPHLIAGPILHHKDMIPQFSRLRTFVVNYKNIAIGICMFTIGLFKKAVIADTFAPWVGLAFDHADKLTFVEAWCGALAYTFQLYFDFSAYSEMAIGLGLMFNLTLPINFNSPYKSTSIIEFWSRWHITLSSFLKNYLYIPLGGNRHGELKKMRNLLFTMLLGGLWHGAGWTFVIWGGLHGIYLIINHQWRKCGIILPKLINRMLTFVAVVVAWVFFRAESVQDAIAIISAMGNIETITLQGLDFVKQNEYGWILGMLLVTMYCKNTQERLVNFRAGWKWLIVVVIMFAYVIIDLNKNTEFLYFQF
ncbi:MAG: rane-bound O-acyltransferase family protein [Firmicutes bacterium]|nr:rane-bound O-acyltransferase family protein [Bacillota bacterium]